MIIMRSGGLDGVALQEREYRYLLNSLDIEIHIVTGQSETEFGPLDPIGETQMVVPEINFFHPDTQLLFANQFVHGPEKKGVATLTRKEWEDLFKNHSRIIKKRILKEIRKTGGNLPVFVFNLLSLRHAHPAAAVAIREIMAENPKRAFISHAADPDAERPEKISRIKKFVLPYLSASSPGKPYSGGAIHRKNLFHIVLNPEQKHNFIHKYHIPKEHIFEIPDFLDFNSENPVLRDAPIGVFLKYLESRRLKSKGSGYAYFNSRLDKNCLFFLSPVRPVYRKRLKESMMIAKYYSLTRKKDVAFVVTHPNLDDRVYFKEVVDFSEKIELPFFHLGEVFSLKTLEDIYEYFANLNTVGVVASSSGGWENALNEMARYCIPFYMNCNLNSFLPLTKNIGIMTHGTDFGKLSDLVKNEDPKQRSMEILSSNKEINEACEWIDSITVPEERKKLTYHNYKKAFSYLSREATLPKVKRMLNSVMLKSGQ